MGRGSQRDQETERENQGARDGKTRLYSFLSTPRVRVRPIISYSPILFRIHAMLAPALGVFVTVVAIAVAAAPVAARVTILLSLLISFAMALTRVHASTMNPVRKMNAKIKRMIHGDKSKRFCFAQNLHLASLSNSGSEHSSPGKSSFCSTVPNCFTHVRRKKSLCN